MERYCFVIKLREGMEAEYKRRHDEIWPDLVTEIRESGVENYTLFRRGREVIAYCECHPNARVAFDRLASSDLHNRWVDWFGDVIESLTDDDGRRLEADEVWHLD